MHEHGLAAAGEAIVVVQALALLAFDVAMLGLSFLAQPSTHGPAAARCCSL